MTTPVTAQGPAIQGMPTQQQGYAPGFPPPLGIEQYFGQPQQQYGGFPQLYGSPQQFGASPQQSGGMPQQFWGSPQQNYSQQPQFPGQQIPVQQIVQSLVSQLLPVAHQVILPQVLATAMHQIPLYLQQFLTQQVGWQLGQQFGQQFGQQPQLGQQGPAIQNLFGRSQPWSF